MSSNDTRLQTELKVLVDQTGGLELLAGLVDLVRPSSPQDADAKLAALFEALGSSPGIEQVIEEAVRESLGSRRLVHALAESGILSDRGIVAEFRGRLAARVLPLPLPADDVRSLIREVFHRSDDWEWVTEADEDSWRRIFALFVDERDFVGIPHEDVAAAILGLAQRAGALGIDEELNARLQSVEDYDSPFLDLTHLARQFLDDHAEEHGSRETFENLVHSMNRCRGLIEHLRANKGKYGTSLRLTAITRRLLQQLRRMEVLVHLVHPRDGDDFVHSLVPVFTELVEAELTSRSISRMLRDHADLFAFQITEETAKKGVKYVTDSAAGYWAFLRKAMRGGAIVAIFALFKAMLSKLELSLAGQAFLYSVNYAACFVLIYLSGSILATKQPAMTASTIGQRLDGARTEEGAIESVAEMVVKVWRSQFVSFVGNLICAFPVAMGIAWVLGLLGFHIADAEKASKLLAEIHPVASGALFFAAVAGVYLFLSGVLSGWVDNFSAYVSLRERLRQLPSPERFQGLRSSFADFVSSNIGVVTGNVILGFMLGTAGTIGVILGLPFDIRHIAFSSANFGVAIQAAPELISLESAIWAAVGVASIGFVNFIVSFGLTLVMTLESRQTTFDQWRHLVRCLASKVRSQPRDWFLPPKQSPGEPDGAEEGGDDLRVEPLKESAS